MIASLKRQAFKLPLPGYTNGTGAMERRYNGEALQWAAHKRHPITVER